MSDDSLQVVLKYGSPQHKHVLEMIRSRKKASQAKMSQYYSKWDDADDAFRAYQPVSERDADRKTKRKVLGQHDYTTVTVPYTFATIMTAHTYWTKVFLSRSPVYQLQGRHGETQDSIEAFEAVLDYQRMVGGHLVPLYNWIFDMAKYGLGIQGSYWDRQETFISRKVQKPATLMGVPLQGQMETTWEQQNILKFEGNCIYNVRPYDWYPDPRVAINNFQAGEFCGRDTQVGWHEIVEGARQKYYFNVEELARKMNTGQYEREYGGSPRVDLPEQVNQAEGETKISGPGFAMLHEMTMRVVPSQLKLSPSSRIEKWCFTVANDDVIIGARPQGMAHDEFPFDIMEFGFGGHEFLKMNLVEVMLPLVDTISWLLNSHFYNVRKALNDQKVVDPSRIVMKDLTSPIERGIIRLKPEAYGSPVQQAVHQLLTPDMTQNHIRDIAVMEQILQRITGVVDELFGMSAGPDRESATGVRTRTGFAANRLMTVAEYNSALGFGPMMNKFISNTQQFMSNEQKFKIAGADGMANAKRFVNVNQDLIAGQYDFIPVDGTLPIDRLAQANFWKELTIQIAASPYANQFSILDMVGHIMRLQGEKNIDRFRLDLKPPEEIARQVQAGNLAQIGGQGGGGNRRPATGSSGATV